MTVTEEWLDSHGVDIDLFMELFGEPTEGEDGYYWTVSGDDADGNGIPDALDALITVPTETNSSKGGAWTQNP